MDSLEVNGAAIMHLLADFEAAERAGVSLASLQSIAIAGTWRVSGNTVTAQPTAQSLQALCLRIGWWVTNMDRPAMSHWDACAQLPQGSMPSGTISSGHFPKIVSGDHLVEPLTEYDLPP